MRHKVKPIESSLLKNPIPPNQRRAERQVPRRAPRGIVNKKGSEAVKPMSSRDCSKGAPSASPFVYLDSRAAAFSSSSLMLVPLEKRALSAPFPPPSSHSTFSPFRPLFPLPPLILPFFWEVNLPCLVSWGGKFALYLGGVR